VAVAVSSNKTTVKLAKSNRVELKSARFATVENLDNDADINRAWETIRENIKISAKGSLVHYELKKHKPWFDKGCLKLLDQRKQA
jgi:hypothetical protein